MAAPLFAWELAFSTIVALLRPPACFGGRGPLCAFFAKLFKSDFPSVAIVRCGSGTFSGPPKEGGFLFRLTIGLRNVDGDWRIAHEHHSVPSTK